jgi:endonuclease-3 related protein
MAIHIEQLYHLLLDYFGHQQWWPVDHTYHTTRKSDPRFEIIVGAILTQNTAWSNVEKALHALKQHHALTIESIASLDLQTLKTLIRSSGFFNQKAHRLQTISAYLSREYHADLSSFFSRDTVTVRADLLRLHGIGPETADSIVLYAGDKPVFVIDAYTRRISRRLPLPVDEESYSELQHFFEYSLQKIFSEEHLVPVYKEFHALLVQLAKTFCTKTPLCDDCPLNSLCQKML